MRFQSTDWIAEFICFCLSDGFSVVVASDDADAGVQASSSLASGKAQDLYAQKRKTNVQRVNTYFAGYLSWYLWRGTIDPDIPVVTIALNGKGDVRDFSLGLAIPIADGKITVAPSKEDIEISKSIMTASAETVYTMMRALHSSRRAGGLFS
jgi:hypothetical protein